MKSSTKEILIILATNVFPVLLFYFGGTVWERFNTVSNSASGEFYGFVGFILLLGTVFALIGDYSLIKHLIDKLKKKK